MLFKKTLKVASATALWMVALLGATSAMAQAYSAEALTGAEDDVSFAVNTATADGFRTTFDLGARLAYQMRTDTVHVRVAAEGVLAFASGNGPSLGYWALDTEDAADAMIDEEMDALADISDGAMSADGDAWVFTTTAITNARSVRLAVTIPTRPNDPDAMVKGIGSGGVSLAVYGTADREGAEFGDDTAIAGPMSEDVLAVARSVSVAPLSSDLIASAASRFTAIKGMEDAQAPYEASLGGFHISINATHLGPDGMVLGDDADYTAVGLVGSTKFSSDAGFAFASGFRFAGVPDANGGACSGVSPDTAMTAAGAVEGNGPGITTSPLSEVEEGEDAPDANEVIGAIKEGPWYLCVSIDNENEVEIAVGDYSLDVTLGTGAMDTRPFPAVGDGPFTVGRITHDGTTVQIPYLTTYEGYNQRIVIVNRSKEDVAYSMTFSTEADVTATPGMAAEGMANGGATTVLRAVDVVTIEGGNRASAQVVLLADPAKLDMATQVVNKMGGGTDTVVLESR